MVNEQELHPEWEGDPESLAGEPIPDPWDDDEQEDWPTERLRLGLPDDGDDDA